MAEKNENAVVYCEPVTWKDGDVKLSPVLINNEPYFIAVELCEALDLTNPTTSLKSLDDDEKLTYVLDRSGQNRMVNLVNESGMYHLIFISRKPNAAKFRKWVTGEVLPTIRKTGRYELASPREDHGRRTLGRDVLDLRCEPYNTKWLGTTTVRVVEYKDVEWYSVADINRAMQVGTDAMQSARNLREANPAIVRKIFIFGNTHPAWFTTITGLRLLVSGSRKLKVRSQMMQLQEGGER